MKIAFDIDDTIMDSFDYFIPFVAEYFCADVQELKEKNISYSTLPAEWQKEELAFARACYDRVVPDTPIKPDAQQVIQKLGQEGHDIVVITARNENLYTDPYYTTRLQLQKNNIQYDKLICTFDKARACVENGVDILFDDSIGNCERAEAAGIRAVVFTSKANQYVATSLPRVKDWNEVYQLIRAYEQSEGDIDTVDK